MAWWQITLILLASIVVGLTAGALVGYVILRIQRKLSLRKREVATVSEARVETSTLDFLGRFIRKREKAKEATEPKTGEIDKTRKKEAPLAIAEQENATGFNLLARLVRKEGKSEAEQLAIEPIEEPAAIIREIKETPEPKPGEVDRVQKKEVPIAATKQEQADGFNLLARLIRKGEKGVTEQLTEKPVEEPAALGREIKETPEPKPGEVDRVQQKEVLSSPGGQLEASASDLAKEVDHNLKIATEPWAGKLTPFQTHIWDTRQDLVNAVPASLKEHLSQAYTDIRLANSVVWLSIELARRSDNLIESYMKLRTSIATELSQVNPLLKQ